MMKSFILCCTVASLCGCDVVPYGRDHAETEPMLGPLFRLGLDYERGTHDLDLGEVKCVFEGAAETRDMARAYETNGWKVLRLTPDRLVVAQGESVIEVVRKVFVTHKRALVRNWGFKVSETQQENMPIPECTREMTNPK